MIALWPSWLFVLGAAFNTSIANILIKESRVRMTGTGLSALLFSPWFIGGLAFYSVSVVLFAKGLEKLPVAAAYPAQAGLAFAMLTLFSFIFLGEALTPVKIAGVVVILFGMMLVAR